MKILTNKFHKKLFFEIFDKPVGIEPNGRYTAEDDVAVELLKSPWIEEVKENIPIKNRVNINKKVESNKVKD